MMKRTHVEDVPDSYDQDVANVLHRVHVERVTVELNNGRGYVVFERTPDPNQHLFEDLSCPDCGKRVNWDEEGQDYVHQSTVEAKHCWTFRNNSRD